jgi:hypothetical protein
MLDAHAVQIWTPASGAGEFLIGDCPAVSLKSFSLLDSDAALAVPLGPQHIAVMHSGTACGYQNVPVDAVERANAAQILSAVANAFACPDTDFGPFAARVRKTQGRLRV